MKQSSLVQWRSLKHIGKLAEDPKISILRHLIVHPMLYLAEDSKRIGWRSPCQVSTNIYSFTITMIELIDNEK